MDSLAVGSIDYAMDEVDRISPFVKIHIIEDVKYHLQKAKEALIQGLDDHPIRWDVIFLLLTALSRNLQEDLNPCSKVLDNCEVVGDDLHSTLPPI
jgi:hypothetical protein